MANIDSVLGDILKEEVAFLLAVNAAGLAETIFYGIHFVLFCICMYILLRNRRSTQWFILISAVIMFALSTADIALTMRLLSHDVADIVFDPTKIPALVKFIGIKNPLFVTNNFIADLILLYRCYMVWGRSKYILIGASFLVLADTIWGYLGMGTGVSLLSQFVPLYIWSIFGINIIMTIVTVGRIFWVSRIARRIIGTRQLHSYHTAMTVIVESSVVYSACVLAYILFPRTSAYRMVLVTICMRVVTIMPTFLIVQVGLGRAVREDNVTVSISEHEARFSSVVLDTIITTQGGAGRSATIQPCLVDKETPDICQHDTDSADPKTVPGTPTLTLAPNI